jgi:hypothetical protein
MDNGNKENVNVNTPFLNNQSNDKSNHKVNNNEIKNNEQKLVSEFIFCSISLI